MVVKVQTLHMASTDTMGRARAHCCLVGMKIPAFHSIFSDSTLVGVLGALCYNLAKENNLGFSTWLFLLGCGGGAAVLFVRFGWKRVVIV